MAFDTLEGDSILLPKQKRETTLHTFYSDDMVKFAEQTEAWRKKIGEENIIEKYYTCNVHPILVPAQIFGQEPQMVTIVHSIAVFRYYKND